LAGTTIDKRLDRNAQDGGQLRGVVVADRAFPGLPLKDVVRVEAEVITVPVLVLPALDLIAEPDLGPTATAAFPLDPLTRRRPRLTSSL
jgi:hypothetical protein